ncbi:MAG: hypothetical protein Q9168_008297, partial [Polycauliona sp. 1 TL-2023]
MLWRWSVPFVVSLPLLVQAFPAIDPRGVETVPENESDVCDNYSSCSIKGLGYWNSLHDTLKDPQSVDRDTTTQFSKYYGLKYDGPYMIGLDDPEIEQAMLSRDMSTEDMGVWEVNAFDPVGKTKLSIYINAFNTAEGIILAIENFRNNDKTAKGNQLQWSETTYQAWKRASAEEQEANEPYGPISNLRAIVRIGVINEETQTVLKAAYVSNGWVAEKDPEWRTWTEDSAQSFFYALLGTPNIKGAVCLLKDHAAEIGRKDISAIHTWWS